jgi:hypothetical protein
LDLLFVKNAENLRERSPVNKQNKSITQVERIAKTVFYHLLKNGIFSDDGKP